MEVGEFYNANFINYKLDMEKGEGPDFAVSTAYEPIPPLYSSMVTEIVVFNRVGGSDAPGFIQMGKTAVDKLDKSPALASKIRRGRSQPFTQYRLY
ncbi:MAG: hypothetical protein IPI42_06715 [Saprospiraceae bacterium]|nr:hypothetical protein [Candidatus Parvibacillus calidus]